MASVKDWPIEGKLKGVLQRALPSSVLRHAARKPGLCSGHQQTRETRLSHAMARHTITIRDLRNHFAKVKQLVETQGEVLVTDKGEPKYRLVLYTPVQKVSAPSKDYIARITRHQPRPLSANEAKGLCEDNRGDR